MSGFQGVYLLRKQFKFGFQKFPFQSFDILLMLVQAVFALVAHNLNLLCFAIQLASNVRLFLHSLRVYDQAQLGRSFMYRLNSFLRPLKRVFVAISECDPSTCHQLRGFLSKFR